MDLWSFDSSLSMDLDPSLFAFPWLASGGGPNERWRSCSSLFSFATEQIPLVFLFSVGSIRFSGLSSRKRGLGLYHLAVGV